MKEDEIIRQLQKLSEKTSNTNHWLFAMYLLITVIAIILINIIK